MTRLLNTIFPTKPFSNRLDISRARAVYAATVLIVLFYNAYAFFVGTQATGQPLIRAFGSDLLATFALIAINMIGVATYWLLRRGLLNYASLGPIAMVYFGICLPNLVFGYIFADEAIILVILIWLSGLFVDLRALLGISVLIVATFIGGFFYRSQLNLDPFILQQSSNQLYTVTIQLVGVAVLNYFYLRIAAPRKLEGESELVQERLKSADISTEITRGVSQRKPLNVVLSQTVEQIRDSYPQIYHAQIFLVDEAGRNARLVASTGEAGRILLERRHSLEVGSQSVIGRVTAASEAVVARAGSADSVHKRNEFLQETRVEAAFPLRVGSEVIGALDLQSKFVDAFRVEDVPIFQALADSIAIGIDNARLFEETAQQLVENQRLVQQANEALAQVERLNQELTERAWATYLQSWQGELGLSIDFQQRSRLPAAEATPTLEEAMAQNHLVQQVGSQGVQVIAIPLRVRGKVIGAMEFELDASEKLTPEDLDLIQQVGERFSTAVENIRLYNESRRSARREASVSEISARLQKSNDIETVLTEAARSLQETLGAGKVAIRLGVPPQGNGHV
jgi:GAF domain-containing protein